MRTHLIAATATLAFSVPTAAQDRVVGLTETTQFLAAQTMDANCATVSCQLNLETAANANAGGTAYDGRSSMVWVTNGTRLAAYLAPDGLTRGCKQACAPVPIPQPVSGVTAYCTGLAFLQSGTLTATGAPGVYGRLYLLYSNNYIGWADVKGCQVFNYKSCSLVPQIGSTNFTGGLAVDVVNRRVFVGWHDGTFGGAYSLICDADQPCNVICKVQLSINRTACGLGHAPLFSMTGLSYNSCNQMLYATDGKQIIWGAVAVSGGNCSFTHRSCCNNTVGEAYTGLALLPAAQSLATQPCVSRSCNACLPQISTTGDAVLGNAQFAINLTNAPSNTAAAALAVGLGACSLPGVSLGYCQPASISFNPPGPLTFLWLGLSATAGTCGRNLTLPVSLGTNPAACGLTLSMQWVNICNGTPVGSAVTGCLNVPISGI